MQLIALNEVQKPPKLVFRQSQNKERVKHLLSTLVFWIGMAACHLAPTPAAYFDVAVIVDKTTDPVSREQAEAILAISNQKMIELTGFGLQMVDFVEDDSGRLMEGLVMAFMADRPTNDLPNGILIFSTGDEDRAKIHRAYALQVPGPEGFRNEFDSPYKGDRFMYVAVLQFNYHYAACGYDDMDTVQSPVSIGAECGGEEGAVCTIWEGMQVCPVALPFLNGHTPIDMAAGPVVHEFMHPFGNNGPGDHYTSEVCHQAMGWEPGQDPGEAEYYNDFCPFVYDVFAKSYDP